MPISIAINGCYGGFSLSPKAAARLFELSGGQLDERPGHEQRANPALIQTIRELGEEANGAYAKLRIIEIPDGVSWQIEEYDGIEWVAETHRTWSA